MTNEPIPKFEVVQGHVQLTQTWYLELGEEFNRRNDSGTVVLWHPGLTLFIDAYKNDKGYTPDELVTTFMGFGTPKAPYDQETTTGEQRSTASYRQKEDRDGKTIFAFYGFTARTDSIVLMGCYADDEADITTAQTIWESLRQN